MENSKVCKRLRLSFLQIVVNKMIIRSNATHSCFVNTKDLIHILIDGEEECVTFSKLISILLFGRQQVALVLAQSGFELIDFGLEDRYLAFCGPEVSLYKVKLLADIQPCLCLRRKLRGEISVFSIKLIKRPFPLTPPVLAIFEILLDTSQLLL